ncbi:MAG: trehalose-6-phosphate synthase [Candidatus Peribacteraceae bacterium]|jgi:trehalose 6-phosphate synthase
MRLSLRFLVPLAAILALIAYAVVPLVDGMMVQWFVKDLDLRSKLIGTAVDDSLFEVYDNDRTKTKKKVQAYFDRMMQDERLFALGFCDTEAALTYKTEKFPETVACPARTAETAVEGTEGTAEGTEEEPSDVVELPKGPVHVAYHTVQGSGRTLGNMILVHDMSFVRNRSEETRRYIMLFIAGVGALIAFITVIIAQLSWRGWVSGMRGLLHGEGLLRPLLPPSTPPELQPVARDLRNLLRDLETDRRLRDDIQTAWTPRTLKDLLQKELAGDEVVVVSNREPYLHVRREGKVLLRTPASGVVTALEPVMRACSGTWIAHGSGDADRETVDSHDHIAVPPDHPRYRLRRVWLTKEEEEGYYYGFSNEGLWPLCHIAHVRPSFHSGDWEQYKKVNEKFAKAVLEEVKTDDPVILIQDYHFALLPRLLHEKLPKASIITFWHIPWPNPEAFGICPWTEEILRGLLGSSVVGFHTRSHCNNFIDTVEHFLECRIDREHWTVSYGGEATGVQRYPISIEFPGRLLRQAKPVQEARADVREKFGFPADRLLGLGVDRFDYTKGILEKFRAVERLLELHPEWIGRFSFVQIAAPTRGKIEQYQRFREEATVLANRINKRFGKNGYEPIILRAEHAEQPEVLELYRSADLCFVGSLHDGMNLVSKEFVAARDDARGVLLLSQFTGAARELPEALLVNPYYADQCAEALHVALTMPPAEQRDRMRNMRGILHDFNVYRWAGRMLLDAARMRQRHRIPRRIFGKVFSPPPASA